MPEFPKNLKSYLIVLGFFAVLGWGIYYAQIMPRASKETQDKKILVDLGKIIVLPEGLAPTMAIITDIEILRKKDPLFFANAKNGDRLILFPNFAIIYDWQANKIINITQIQNAKI